MRGASILVALLTISKGSAGREWHRVTTPSRGLSLTPAYSVANFYSGMWSGSITDEMMRTAILNCYTHFETSTLRAGMEGFSCVRPRAGGPSPPPTSHHTTTTTTTTTPHRHRHSNFP